jgi:hypothetical protein
MCLKVQWHSYILVFPSRKMETVVFFMLIHYIHNFKFWFKKLFTKSNALATSWSPIQGVTEMKRKVSWRWPSPKNFAVEPQEKEKWSYPCKRPWRPIRLWDVEAPIFSRKLAHRWKWGCQPYAPACRPLPAGIFLKIFTSKGDFVTVLK